MMQPSFDCCDNGVVGFGLVNDVMVSDDKVSRVLENAVAVDDRRFGENVVESGVGKIVSKVGEMNAISLVVDLSRCSNGSRFSPVKSFDPVKMVDVMRELANDPFGFSSLDVSRVGDELLAFNRWKGYHQLQVNQVLDELDDDKFDVTNYGVHSKGKSNARGRPRKLDKLDNKFDVTNSALYSKGKSNARGRPRKLDELDENFDVTNSALYSKGKSNARGRPRKLDELDENFDVTNSVLHSKGKQNARGRPRKRRELIDGGYSPRKKVKISSELTSDDIESGSDVEWKPRKSGQKRKAIEYKRSGEGRQSQSQTADEFLSRVYMAARNPTEAQRNLESLVKFTSDFKNHRSDGFADIKDSYWADMTIVNESVLNLKADIENSATSLTFKFSNLDTVPSVRKLHAIYRRYGALLETETRVMKKKKCVKLVFQRRCDAETAFSSPGKFSIFGSALLYYQLNFAPTLRKTDMLGKKGVISLISNGNEV